MALQTELTPAEAADRLALHEPFDANAHCADRRDAEGQTALFSADTRFAVYMDGEGSEPTYVLEGREALTPVFADLNRYGGRRPTGVLKRASHTDALDPAERSRPIILVHGGVKVW